MSEQDDMFGACCIDCGEPVTDERPSGETDDGPVHYGCGDPS